MLAFLKSLFFPQSKRKAARKPLNSKPSGKVVIMAAEPYNKNVLTSVDSVTVLPVWYLNSNSFDHVKFSYPSTDLIAPVITDDSRALLKRYVRDVCPEPDSSIVIYQKLNNSEASVKEIAAMVSSDPMLAAQILKLVNSAAFGVDREITSVGRAVTLLGFQNVKSLVLNHSIRRGVASVESELSHRIREHSTMSSAIGYYLAEQVAGLDSFEISTLALLHDMGKLLSPMIAEHGKGLKLSATVPEMVVEALIASVFAEIWQLPATLVQSLEFSHHPCFYSLQDVPPVIRKQVTVLAMSNLLSNAMGYPDGDLFYPVRSDFLSEIRQEDSPARWIDGAMATKIEQFRGVLK